MTEQIKIQEICPTTTQACLKEGALLVDVRESDEVQALAYDAPEVLHIPLSEFDVRYQEIPKDRKVVVACKGGGRSLRATGFLVNHGYENAVNMQHGIVRWVQRGFPTKGDTASVLGTSGECCSAEGCC